MTAVNGQLISTDMDLSGYQALEVMVNDQGGILQSNLPVRIILPKDDQERKIISGALNTRAAEAHQAMTTRTTRFLKNVALSFIAALSLMGKAEGQTNNIALTQPTAPQQISIDLNSVENLVGSNRLVSGIQAIEVLQKKQEEKLP